MMKRNMVVALILALALTAVGMTGAQEIEWVHQFGAIEPVYDNCSDVDLFGNLYVSGITRGTLPGQSSSGGYADGYLRKYDPDGNEIWTRQFGTSGYDQVTALAVDNTGVYALGFTSGVLPGQEPIGGDDAYIRKYDLDGNELWTHQFGTTGPDYPASICVDPAGVYVTGMTFGAFEGFEWAGHLDVFIRQYSTDGVEGWTLQFGTPNWDQGCGIAAYDNHIYVTGFLDETGPLLTSSVAFLHKYDSCGNRVWERDFGASDGDVGIGVCADRNGIYASGFTDGALAGWTSAGGIDAFLLKYSPEGDQVWAHQLGTPGSDHGHGVCSDDFGVYLTGMTDGVLPGQTGLGGTDGYICSYGHSGSLIWTLQFGTPVFETSSYVASGDATVYAVGFTWGVFPGQTGSGGPDAYVAKIAVTHPELLLLALIDAVTALNLHQGIENSLDAKLGVAVKALQDLKENNDIAAVNALGAFINEVEAQRGNKIAEEHADGLIAAAQHILDLLGHGGGQQSAGTPARAATDAVLFQNWPNPFEDRTTVCFSLPDVGHALLTVHDIAGRTLKVLMDEDLAPGLHTLDWNPNFPAGSYFLRMQVGQFTATRRMTVIR